MATITLTIPDDQITRIIDAFCERWDYDGYVERGGTLTRAQFTKKKVGDWVKATVVSWEYQNLQAVVTPPTAPDVA